jgi:K+-sensing histidine kinase KdpD
MENSRVCSGFPVILGPMRIMLKGLPSVLRVPLGTCLCVFVSGVITALSRNSSIKTLVPIMFLWLIIFVALKFGSLAAALGTLIAGGTFAFYLFAPFHSLLVADPIARGNLMSMVLLGLIVAHFLPPPSNNGTDPRASLQ